MVRGAHRNPTNPWCSGPQGLPTSLNISTNMIIHPPLHSSLCNMAIPESSQNLEKSYSIRFSTKIQLHPEAEQMPTDDRDICWGGVPSHGFHLSPVPAWTRLDLRCSESFNFKILVLGRGSFEAKLRFLNFLPKYFQNFDRKFVGWPRQVHWYQKFPCCVKKFQICKEHLLSNRLNSVRPPLTSLEVCRMQVALTSLTDRVMQQ